MHGPQRVPLISKDTPGIERPSRSGVPNDLSGPPLGVGAQIGLQLSLPVANAAELQVGLPRDLVPDGDRLALETLDLLEKRAPPEMGSVVAIKKSHERLSPLQPSVARRVIFLWSFDVFWVDWP